ncbi:V-type ATP synthase subunit E family protein [Acidihalobacter prosperus]
MIDESFKGLLDYLERETEAGCSAVAGRAEREAHSILEEAYGESRRRVHEAVADERRRLHEELRRAAAEVGTLERLQRQRRQQALLDQAMRQLRAELVRRWHAPQQRRVWLHSILKQGLTHLPKGDWRVEHGRVWGGEEIALIQAAVLRLGGVQISYRLRTSIDAGLLVHAGGVVLDGTIDGLLAYDESIRARLLAHLDEAERE